MNITLEETERFKTMFEELIKKYSLVKGGIFVPEILRELYLHAANESTRFVRPKVRPEHRTGVNNSQIDFNIIMMSIIAISWAVRMRKVKSIEGQCHVHTRECEVTKGFHSEIYGDWVAAIEELLTVLKSDMPPAPAAPASKPA
jgi:hypothetical protein